MKQSPPKRHEGQATQLIIIPKSKIKTRKRKKKKKAAAANNMPVALQKFSFVNNTTEKMSSGDFELGRTSSGPFGRADSGPFGLTVASGQMVGKFFGEATLSNLGKQFPAPKSRIGEDPLSALSKEFSLARLRL